MSERRVKSVTRSETHAIQTNCCVRHTHTLGWALLRRNSLRSIVMTIYQNLLLISNLMFDICKSMLDEKDRKKNQLIYAVVSVTVVVAVFISQNNLIHQFANIFAITLPLAHPRIRLNQIAIQ